MAADFELSLLRKSSGAVSTLGDLFINALWSCFTLEDRMRAHKVHGSTRIGAGRYPIKLHPGSRLQSDYREIYGPKHHGMLLLVGVPNFSGILLHHGNRHKDTLGCPLVGFSQSANTHGKEGNVGSSREAYREILLPLIVSIHDGATAAITVVDEDYRVVPPVHVPPLA